MRGAPEATLPERVTDHTVASYALTDTCVSYCDSHGKGSKQRDLTYHLALPYRTGPDMHRGRA